jgi:hypothetical protein
VPVTLRASALRSKASSRCDPSGLDFETHSFPALKDADDFEQITGTRIARGSKHSHEALGRNSRCFRQFSKSYRRVDVIPQNSLCGDDVARKHSFETFAQKLLSELGIALDASANGLFEIASQGHRWISYFLRL